MRYSLEIRKFIYSQYFFGGLRIALGVSLPAILMLTVFHNRELGFTIATGALGASVVDMPGPLKYKHNEMLACTVIGFLSALATGIASANAVTLWLSVVPLTLAMAAPDRQSAGRRRLRWPPRARVMPGVGRPAS